MPLGTCYACGGNPPVCATCFDELLGRWSANARTFGWRWGAGIRLALDRRGEAHKTWPSWESDAAVNVRKICKRLVAPLANSVPERRDPRLVEAFARICASAAEEAYGTLTLEDARLVVADYDQRHPGWRDRLRAGGL